MICQHCGKELREDDVFCPLCGMRIEAAAPQNDSSQQNDMVALPQENTYSQPQPSFNNQGQNASDMNATPDISYQMMYYKENPQWVDEPHVMMNIVSFFIPMAGFIVYIFDKKRCPIKAKSVLKCAFLRIGLDVLLTAVILVSLFTGALGFFGITASDVEAFFDQAIPVVGDILSEGMDMLEDFLSAFI